MAPALFQVGPDTVVHFSYRLYDEEGDLIEGEDSSVRRKPNSALVFSPALFVSGLRIIA